MSINYELLRTFVEAARGPTFAQAAERRHISAPAVSQQIASLEAQIGAPLFQRIGKRTRLNDAGRNLLRVAEPHLHAIEHGLQELVAARDAVQGTITLGAPRPFGRFWLRPRATQLLERYEDLVVCVRYDGPTALRRALLEGACDLCVLVEDPNHAALESEIIHVEEFVAVASPSYLTKVGMPASAEDFRKLRYIVFDDDLPMHAPFWRAAFGRREPLPPRVVAKLANLDEMLALACAGIGVAVLPRYLVEESLCSRAVVMLPTSRSKQARTAHARNPIHLAWRKDAVESPRFVAARGALLAQVGSHAPGRAKST
jgi:DNA-binding transcriptional LysR family regulator